MEVRRVAGAIGASLAAGIALWSCGQIAWRTSIELAPATYIGTSKCLECHEEDAAELEGSRHWVKADGRAPHGEARHGCESCHGPGSVHAEERLNEKGGHANLIQFGAKSPFPASQQDAQCLQCHRSDRTHWASTRHHQADVSCASCHQAHGRNEKQLAAKNETDLCLSCHREQAFQSEMVSHHPIREGKMGCTSCHDPHGSGAGAGLKAPTANDLCLKCHTDKRGPFLWEHPPVREDCISCHNPHGSIHNKMLKAAQPFLCQQCHSNSRHPGTLYSEQNKFDGASPSNKVFGASCMNCHPSVHGSNHPSGKMLTR